MTTSAPATTFRDKIEAGQFVMSVEVDPPHGLNPGRAVEGARLLRDAGADAINVGDSPTAKVRMSPLAMSVLLKQELGVDIVMHYTTRDRNTGSSNPQDTYGVYRTDWTPKPAAYVIKSLA